MKQNEFLNFIKQHCETTDNILFATTTKQVRITNTTTGENQVYSPNIYQSCMQPEQIILYEMTLQLLPEHLLQIENHYGTWWIDLSEVEIEFSDWKGEIHKTDCKKCENCGRCGW